MRFNLIYDFHKNPNWSDFYFEYVELKKYLKNARKFLHKQVKYECKRHPSNNNLKNIRELELKHEIKEKEKIHHTFNGKLNNNHILNGDIAHNHSTGHNFNHHNTIDYVTILKQVKNFDNLECFSKKYIRKFKKKLKKVEYFFLSVREDLISDFERLKHLVLECEDIEVCIIL